MQLSSMTGFTVPIFQGMGRMIILMFSQNLLVREL